MEKPIPFSYKIDKERSLMSSTKFVVRLLPTRRGRRLQAGYTQQILPDMRKPPLRGCDPMPIGPRRIVADVLLMSTFKVGNPVEGFVQMKIYNFARDAYCMGLRYIHVSTVLYVDGHFSFRRMICAAKIIFPRENGAGLSGFAILGSSKVKWAVFH
jgi:hypothetical protein